MDRSFRDEANCSALACSVAMPGLHVGLRAAARVEQKGTEDVDVEGVKEDDPSSSDEDEYKDSGLTSNQQRLLYMISLYTHPARTKEETEAWVRSQALMVLIYEAIVSEVSASVPTSLDCGSASCDQSPIVTYDAATFTVSDPQVLDYDYAPASANVEGRRLYFNLSQEGRSDVDFLREEGLINGLKLSSKTCVVGCGNGEHINGANVIVFWVFPHHQVSTGDVLSDQQERGGGGGANSSSRP